MNANLFKRLSLAAVTAAVAASTLTACAPLMLGAAAGTALVASDRRTSGTQLEDEGIELRAGSRIRENFGTRVRVDLTSYNRQVLMTGEVPNAQDKQAVQDAIAKVDGVTSVVNELSVSNTPSLLDRSSDLVVTSRVKAAMFDAKDLQANAVKVVTERGTVYLMGRVTKREAERATELARSVPGVKRVVRIFEEITDEELRRIMPAPAPAASGSVKL